MIFGRMSELFLMIYRQPLHRIIIFIILIVWLWGYLGNSFREKSWWKLLNVSVFAGTVVAICFSTLYSRGESTGEIFLIPFHSFIEAKKEPELYRSMLMNVFLFVPLGLSFPFTISKQKHSVVITVIFAFLFSVGIEAIQYYYKLGMCETDDVIMNTLGALIGAFGWIIAQKL